MEEQKNVVNTSTTEKEGSKFGWGVLGFFIPLVGLILFLVWMKDKKKAAKAAGIGAIIGFVLGLIMSVLSVYLFFEGFFDSDIGSKDIIISKANDSSDNFSISDYEYVLDFSDEYIAAKKCDYIAIEEPGKKIFTIEKINTKVPNGLDIDYKVITNNGKEIPFGEYYSGISPYEKYHFYYNGNVVLFNVKNNNTEYYLYDLKSNKLFSVFNAEDDDNGLLKITDIVINEDESITFKATYNEETIISLHEKNVYNNFLDNKYDSLESLQKELSRLKIKDFAISKEITYEKISGNYSSTPKIKKQTIIDLYKEKNKATETTSNRTKDCTGKYTKGSNKYEYVMDLKNDATECKTITYKLNDDFTVKYELVDDEYWSGYTMYVNGQEVDSGLIDFKGYVYINGKTLVTSAFSTDEGAPVLLVNTNGEIYSIEGYTNGNPYSGTDVLKIDGMTKRDRKVDENGNLIVSGSKHSNQCGERIGDVCLSQRDICANSFEALASTYGIDDNYAFTADYTFKLKSDGLYDLEYSDVKTTKTWHQFYNEICNR